MVSLFAACGAVVNFYFLFPLFRSNSISAAVLFAPVLFCIVLLCLFRVLSLYPLLLSESVEDARHPETIRRFKSASSRIAAFTVGLVLGISAGAVLPGRAPDGVVFAVSPADIHGISGTLLEDPRVVSGGRVMASLSLGRTMSAGGVSASASGEITVFFPEESAERLREFGRGTEVAASGYLRIPNRDGSRFDAYLFSADSLHITKPAPPLERFRTGLRLSLIRRFSRPDSGELSNGVPWGGLAQSLLLGVRDNLDSGFAASYRKAGCSYILALSGMHLAVLTALISLLLKRALGMRAAAVAGAVIIIMYCFLVGPFPSLVRSALMYLLGVMAVLGMLKKDVFSLLCMAFVLQLAVTPQAGFSIAFMLSYLALAGIIIIGGKLARIFRGKIPNAILVPLSASFGAFVVTAGITVFYFDILYPAGIIAGVILAPLATPFMVGSILWLILDLISPAISSVLNLPLSLLYTLMERVASLAAYIPGITLNFHAANFITLALVAIIVWFDFRRKAASSRLDAFA